MPKFVDRYVGSLHNFVHTHRAQYPDISYDKGDYIRHPQYEYVIGGVNGCSKPILYLLHDQYDEYLRTFTEIAEAFESASGQEVTIVRYKLGYASSNMYNFSEPDDDCEESI